MLKSKKLFLPTIDHVMKFRSVTPSLLRTFFFSFSVNTIPPASFFPSIPLIAHTLLTTRESFYSLVPPFLARHLRLLPGSSLQLSIVDQNTPSFS